MYTCSLSEGYYSISLIIMDTLLQENHQGKTKTKLINFIVYLLKKKSSFFVPQIKACLSSSVHISLGVLTI